MKSKLTKAGKKKKKSFLKSSLILSCTICAASAAIFLPLINSGQAMNQNLLTEIEAANRETEIIQKNNQELSERSEIEK